jgi:hypothetical protein
MLKKKSNIIFALVILAILVWVVKDTFTQKTVNDLKGGFTEKALYRNDNNTGPVQRIYSVSVKDPANAELEAYGNFMPHTKYGNTKVYFFKEGEPTPTTVYPGDVNFDAVYEKNCIALYEKSAMGNYGIILNPFTQKQKNQ